MIKVLVINSGGSSIKYQLFDMDGGTVLVSGAVERIGEAESLHWQRVHTGDNVSENRDKQPVADHQEALMRIGTQLR